MAKQALRSCANGFFTVSKYDAYLGELEAQRTNIAVRQSFSIRSLSKMGEVVFFSVCYDDQVTRSCRRLISQRSEDEH